jgi:hypothetical protein
MTGETKPWDPEEASVQQVSLKEHEARKEAPEE